MPETSGDTKERACFMERHLLCLSSLRLSLISSSGMAQALQGLLLMSFYTFIPTYFSNCARKTKIPASYNYNFVKPVSLF